MSKSHITGVVIALILIAGSGFYIRSSEAGFYAHLKKDYAGAEAGLKARVAAGDGFAAYLLGVNRYWTRVPGTTREQAIDWYKMGIELGDLSSAAGYMYAMAIIAKPGSGTCQAVEKILTAGAGVGHLLVTSRFGEILRSGGCMAKDLVRAGYYFEQARLIDPRMGTLADQVRTQLTPEETSRLEELLKSPPAPLSEDDFLALVGQTIQKIESTN